MYTKRLAYDIFILVESGGYLGELFQNIDLIMQKNTNNAKRM